MESPQISEGWQKIQLSEVSVCECCGQRRWVPSVSSSIKMDEFDVIDDNRPYALTSSKRHLRGKTVTKQSNRTDLYARRTGLADEHPPFDLWVRAPYWNDVMCKRSIPWPFSLFFLKLLQVTLLYFGGIQFCQQHYVCNKNQSITPP